MAIKKVKSIKKTVKRKAPILSHKNQKAAHIKKHKTTVSRVTPLTIAEHNKALKIYQEFFKKGVTVRRALGMSLDIDFERMRTELTATYIKGISNGMMTFTVKASGKHLQNRYGVPSDTVADRHDVNISFDMGGIKKATEEGLTQKDVLLNTPIAFQCDCGRHTYWYRYTWTLMRASIGLQEKRFPRIRNKELKGILCKHGIRVMLLMQSKSFLTSSFSRYMTNVTEGKGFRFVDSDKKKFAGVSMFS